MVISPGAYDVNPGYSRNNKKSKTPLFSGIQDFKRYSLSVSREVVTQLGQGTPNLAMATLREYSENCDSDSARECAEGLIICIREAMDSGIVQELPCSVLIEE